MVGIGAEVRLNKAFTKEDDAPDPLAFRSRFQPLPVGFRNLITAAGAARLRGELAALLLRAASEPSLPDSALQTADAGRKRLRGQIDDLVKRLETHEVTPPLVKAPERVCFGATVTVRDDEGQARRYTLVGVDEADAEAGLVSWTSPLARALLNQQAGNIAKLQTPRGDAELEIVAISR